MPPKTAARNPAMDVIRSFACFFVVSVHFFLHNGFYSTTVLGPRMYIMTLMRSFFMICVPLFMVLTGYLTCKKTISKGYYAKITYTLSIYVLASLCCVLYKTQIQDISLSASQFLRGFLNFTNAPYAWYVEMYIGLFLLCPILNGAYNSLKTQRQKQVLLATFLLLTALPYVTNIFIPDLEWFLHPTSSRDYYELLPNYWTSLYPITYYFIGCYLREYKLNLRCKTIAILSVLVFLLNGSFNYYRSFGTTFVKGAWQEYGSLFILVQTVLFFAFFDNLDYSKFPAKLSKLLSKISELSFGVYLLSWIFDTHFYKILNSAVSDMPLRLNYYPVIVPIVFICSLTLSLVINYIHKLLALLVTKARPKPQCKV